MQIFIDESGGFQPSNADRSISCVCAATIPGRVLDVIESEFREFTRTWPRDASGELKGRNLSERHLAELCDYLAPKHVLFEATIMDMNHVTGEEVKYHKSMQARGIVSGLMEEHSPNIKEMALKLKEQLDRMPQQLYAQAVALKEVVWNAQQIGELYFCQRWPGELGNFAWTIDAKDNKITEYEEWWRESVMPLLQTLSMRKPAARLVGGDYSAYTRNYPPMEIPEYLLKQQPGATVHRNAKGVNLQAIFRDLRFSRSRDVVGLQIIDILANGLRRALSDRLAEDGWRGLSNLMVHRKEGAVRLITLGQISGSKVVPYAAVVKKLNAGGRTMLVPDKRKRRGDLSNRGQS